MYHCNVKQKSSIKRLTAMLSIIGLVTLLLFSPCNVRKHLQSSLGLTQTEVSNKSKAIVGNSSCSFQDDIETAVIISKASDYSLTALSITTDEVVNSMDIAHFSIPNYTSKEHEISIVPYYILYRNFKEYL